MGSPLLARVSCFNSCSGTNFCSFFVNHPSTFRLLLLENMPLISSNDRKWGSFSSKDFASGIRKCRLARIEFPINSENFLGLNLSSGGTYISKLIFSGRLSVERSMFIKQIIKVAKVGCHTGVNTEFIVRQ